jgi:hypothetical protein
VEVDILRVTVPCGIFCGMFRGDGATDVAQAIRTALAKEILSILAWGDDSAPADRAENATHSMYWSLGNDEVI